MLVLLVIAIVSLTYTSIRSIIAANREAELDRVQRIVELMTTSRFPLTSSVLENMKLLSGAEFVFSEGNGEADSKTSGAPPVPQDGPRSKHNGANQTDPKTIEINGQPYLHTAVLGIRNGNQPTKKGVLNIFVPSQSEQTIWWQASKSPLQIALFMLPLALIFSLALASQVTRPLAKLNQQVQQIAEGDVQPIPAVGRNDEIHDLNESINEMAVKLQDHDTQLRKNERLRTMVQFGSGVAHHLRNSATGCKMAVELLAAEQPGIADTENYQVAVRQLGLMDNYIKKFLLLSKSPITDSHDEIGDLDLSPVLDNVVFLLRPSAEHLGVDLSVESKCDNSSVKMLEEDAQQLMMNLMANAIRAASEIGSTITPNGRGFVSVELLVEKGCVKFSVTDNGSGPPEKIAASIFDPFVTGSTEGTGLGLSLVHEISERTNGRVSWCRENHQTTFSFESENQQAAKVK